MKRSKTQNTLLVSKMISPRKFNPTIHNDHAIIVTLAGAATAHKIQPDGTIHLTRPDNTTYNPFHPKNLPKGTKILIP